MSTTAPVRRTTRSRATAEDIAAARPFFTSGNLRGVRYDPPMHSYIYAGHLNSVESSMLYDDRTDFGIDYVVLSYSTPIAWRRADGKWRIVAQSFSITTSKHQGNLYLIDRGAPHDVNVIAKRGDNQVTCEECGTDPRHFLYVEEARRFAHGHRFNHDHPVYAI